MNGELGLQCHALTCAFPDSEKGIFDITLSVPPASVYVLLGGNGAGKTTLINVCLSYLAPSGGSICIAGVDVALEPTEAKRRLAYVPEVARLYPHLSAIENLRFFEALRGAMRTDEEIIAVLVRLNFPRAAVHDASTTYSKGMRQKVVIAAGLLKGADVFLLDEPTTGLDPISIRQFKALVHTLRGAGKAVLIASHDIHNVQTYADRVGVLQNGRLLREYTPTELDASSVDEIYPEYSNA